MTKKSNSINAFKEGINSDFKVQVSYFEKVKLKACSNVQIQGVIADIKNGKYSILIEEIRKENILEKKKLLKETLPAITVSGTFNNSHSEKDLIKHSGLIQIDLDQINPSMERIKLEKDKFTFCCFLSPSGNGLKLIVKIDPDNHEASFQALKRYYSNQFNLEIDRKCKDVGRCMFVSYDENLYFNPDSMVFPIAKNEPIALNKDNGRRKRISDTNTLLDNKLEDLELLIGRIEERKLDITIGYDNWLKIGFALASTFGEVGRNYFHRLSFFNQQYTANKTNLQYDKCIVSKNTRVNIGTLYFIAKNYGISISKKNEITEGLISGLRIADSTYESTCEKVEIFLSETYEFRRNEITGEIEYRELNESNFSLVNEDNLHRSIQHYGLKFSLGNLTSLLRSDFVSNYNPFLNYYKGLPEWKENSDPDYIFQLASKVKAKDQVRFNKQIKKMMVRVVACALDEKVFNKHAFILVHDQQNSGKSTFCRFLCPPDLHKYISESFAMDKDSLISLSENIFINLDELSTLSKIEINTLKSMFTKDKVKIRKPYEKKATNSPRRCSFIGSTNKTEFLNDETGSVRWLCFEINGIDFSYSMEISIDSVWSQAYSLYLSGFEYQLTADEIKENEIANEKHLQISFEHELILKYFSPSEKNTIGAEFKTATELALILSEKAPQLRLRHSNTMMGKALKSLGFKQDQAFNGKYQRKGYYVILIKEEK